MIPILDRSKEIISLKNVSPISEFKFHVVKMEQINILNGYENINRYNFIFV